MGKKVKKRIIRALKIVLGCLAGLVLLLVVALNILVSEPVVRKLVDRYAPELMDGSLEYDRCGISIFSSFPYVDLYLSDLSLTYPSEMFPEAGDDCAPGRVDTLLSLSKLRVSISYMDLLSGRYNVRELLLQDPFINAHCYTDKVANWNVIKSTRPSDGDLDEDKESEGESSSDVAQLPEVVIGSVRFCGDARIVYSSVPDDMAVSVRFDDMTLKGDVAGVGLDEIVGRSRLALNAFRLGADVRMESDTVSLDMNSFSLSLEDRILKLGLDTHLDYSTLEDGSYCTPLSLLAQVSLPEGGGKTGLHAVLDKFDAAIFDIPLSAGGCFRYYPDSLWMDLRMDATGVSPKSLLSQYAANYLGDKNAFEGTESRLNMWVTAKGSYCGDASPVMDAGVRNLRFHAPDLDLVADAAMWNILDDDPSIDLTGDLDAEISKICEFLPADSGICGSGSVCMQADVRRIRLSQIDPNNFASANVTLSADGRDIDVRMDSDRYVADTLTVRMSSSKKTGMLTAEASAGALSAVVDGDQINLSGANLQLSNSERIISSDLHPLQAGLSFKTVSMRMAQERLFLSEGRLELSVTPRDTTARRFRPSGMRRPSGFSGQDDFKESDLDLSLDKETSDYLRDWSFSGDLKCGRASYYTPEFPLLNEISKADISFTDNEIGISRMSVRSGNSRFLLDGSVKGLRRVMQGRGRIRAALNIDAQHIDVNQLMAASEKGDQYVRSLKERSESVAADTLSVPSVSEAPSYSSLLVIPSNLVLDLNLKARNVTYKNLRIKDMSGQIHAKDRCAQMVDTRIVTNMGELGFDGFYYTKSLDNIAAGFNLVLMDVSAEQAIALIPEVEDVLPQLKSFEGNMNLELTATTMLDTEMEPIPNTLNGVFKISGSDLLLKDLGDLKSIARMLLFRDTSKGYIKNLDVCGVVNENSLELFPFLLKIDRYSLGLSGVQNFDETFKYHASVIRSPLLVKFGVDLSGDFDDFDYRLRSARYRREKMPAYDERVDSYQERLIEMIRNIHDVEFEKAFLASRDRNWLSEAERQSLEKGVVNDVDDSSLDSATLEMIRRGEFTSPDQPVVSEEQFKYIPVKKTEISLPHPTVPVLAE